MITNTPSIGRLEFEYTNSIWKVVGEMGVVPDVQVDIARPLIKSASNYSTYYAEEYLRSLMLVKISPISNPTGIRQVIRKTVKFQAATTGDNGVVRMFKVQHSDPTGDAVLSSPTTVNNVKFDVNSITLGTC